ncbi:AarF/UbiB family protein [Lentisphaerota bacterium ZTH]|nr:protein kinase family protein [Lentisphaerota bacterium]WET07231.1 AarF/UbiB family protein [Lentisphaerota bacterium ZTH]
MPGRFTQQYTDGAFKLSPLRAFQNAAQNYIDARVNWGKGETAYGYRGGWSNLKLFFNREITAQNVKAMRKVLSIVRNRGTLVHKKSKLLGLRREFSEGGRGIELLDTFLSTSFSSDNMAYVSSDLTREKSFIIANSAYYEKRKTLGSGSFGQTDSFQSQSGHRLAIKHVFSNKGNQNALEFEISIFKKVYQELYLKKFAIVDNRQDTAFLESGRPREIPTKDGKKEVYHSVIMPEIDGTSLQDFVRNDPEGFLRHGDDIYMSVFNFLHDLHFNLGICHGDCHDGNVMLLEYHNVFLIDYGNAQKYNNFNKYNWNEMMTADLIIALSYYIYLSSYCQKMRDVVVDRQSLLRAATKFDLGRWMGETGICHSLELFCHYQAPAINDKLRYMRQSW